MAKNIFDEPITNEILVRIEKLSPASQRRWGKMDVAQMLAHLSTPLRTALGELKAKNVYVPVVSPLFKRYLINKGRFWEGKTPTMGEFLIKDQRDFDTEKKIFLALFARFVEAGRIGQLASHPFFGKMDAADWGKTTYVHFDHHLRQFGV